MNRNFSSLFEEMAQAYALQSLFSFKSGFRTKTYTYKKIYDFVSQTGAYFASLGVAKGDRILMLSLNRPEYAVLIFGALLHGITIIPIDYRTNKETIEKFWKKTHAKAVFTTKLFTPLFSTIETPIYDIEELFDVLVPFEKKSFPQIEDTHLAAIMFTSGTTGDPKGTMISLKNIISSIHNTRSIFSLPVGFKSLSILPLSHVLELIEGLCVAYTCGVHIHYIERINSITIRKALKRYRISGMAVVPQMLRMLLLAIERSVTESGKKSSWELAQKLSPFLPRLLQRKLFSQVHKKIGGEFKLFACGSAPLEKKLARLWENMGVTVLEGYGASETTGVVSTNTFQNKRLGTVGKILPGISYKISDAKELWVKSDSVVSGYFENEEKTKAAFEDGWFKTGDIVTIDADGYMSIVGRDTFKIVLPDGKKVYPEDIEKKLNNNPNVVDSCVLGVPSKDGEEVFAAIKIKEGSDVKDIITEVNSELNAHEQIMNYSVWDSDDFPRTKTLKIDRAKVKDVVLNTVNKDIKDISDAPKLQEADQIASLLALVTEYKGNITNQLLLTTDLKMDSLRRIELLALIEEEMGVAIDEMAITATTTVGDLRKLVSDGKPSVITDGEEFASWQLQDKTDNLRVWLQDHVAFPTFNLGLKMNIIHPENLSKIRSPQLFIFNHVGEYDAAMVVRALPKNIRRKTAAAATADAWHAVWYYKYFMMLFGNAFPFVKAESHRSMRDNFERVGELLDKGYNIIISPEGNISPDGKLLPFHTGAGYIAVEMGVPVTPFKLKGYYELWPERPERKLNHYWPVKLGSFDIVVGEPMTFSKKTTYEEATDMMRKVLSEL